VGLDFAKDGRIFIAEKSGIVRVLLPSGDLQDTPWLDISANVSPIGDRGLLGIALHPLFPTNPSVYIYYTQKPVLPPELEDDPNVPQDIATQAALFRIQEGANGVADMKTIQYFFGEAPGTGVPACSSTHNGGDMRFGNDGTLLLTTGEGANWEFPDYGQILPDRP
jgi:glucose/arabinose dehydrogenase